MMTGQGTQAGSQPPDGEEVYYDPGHGAGGDL
jgi:hypothetical protein